MNMKLLLYLLMLHFIFDNEAFDLSESDYEQLAELYNDTIKFEHPQYRNNYYTEIFDPLQLTPRVISREGLFLYVMSPENEHGITISLDVEKIRTTSFRPNRPTIIYIHGWRSDLVRYIKLYRASLLGNGLNLNLLILNWMAYADTPLYIISWQAVEEVGKHLAGFLLNMERRYNYPLSQITLVGFSLGAHVSGFVGKFTNRRIQAIVGLDPAGILYYSSDPRYRLNEQDARHVQVIHTSSFMGSTFKIGKQDFWLNGGENQPGCSHCLLTCIGCSHSIANDYYTESVGVNRFIGWWCPIYMDFLLGLCSRNPVTYMGGLNINTLKHGNYYLRTNAKPPYGKGSEYSSWSD